MLITRLKKKFFLLRSSTSNFIHVPQPEQAFFIAPSPPGGGIAISLAPFSIFNGMLTTGLEPITQKEQILNLPCLPFHQASLLTIGLEPITQKEQILSLSCLPFHQASKNELCVYKSIMRTHSRLLFA